jgi:type VI secretion system secreted protein VgrG
MDAYSQDQRLLQIDTVLGKDHLLLVSFEGEDRISSCFSYDLELASTDPNLGPEDLLGSAATVWIGRNDAGPISRNGIISRFSISGRDGRGLYLYRARLVPSLWLLTRTSDCRIFQDQNVRGIVDAVLLEYGVQSREWKLLGEHGKRDYCVQYRETAYDFVCRLLEEEGICFFFRHDAASHVVVLSDDNQGFAATGARLPITVESDKVDGIWQWEKTYRFRTGQWAMGDFNFETPSATLTTQQKTINKVLAKRPMEMFHYPGRYDAKGSGDSLTKLRIEYEEAAYQETAACSARPELFAGASFAMSNADKADADQKFVVTTIRHTAQDWSLVSQDSTPSYTNSFRCVPAAAPYRPEMKTPRPRIHGTQTAIVTGPGGAEIATDKYGRIKVQFHWDRYGKKDENSSCWIRVAQIWAGRGWGGWFLPRIGQEVVVSFLDGDPDRPLVVGSVYNAEQPVPFPLPGNATQSGVRTRSSMGGSPANCNELRFEDKKGSEQVFFHAEKDYTQEVEHDASHWVGHDETTTIDHDRTEHVKHDETITIDNNRTETVHANETITVDQNRTETVHANETVTINKNRTHTVMLNDTLTVAVARTETVGAAETITVGAVRTVTVGADQTVSVGGSQSINVGSDQVIAVGGGEARTVADDRATKIGKNDGLNVGKSLLIDAGDEIVLKTGSATITMKKSGDITIEGKQITIKGSGDVVIKGQKILQN